MKWVMEQMKIRMIDILDGKEMTLNELCHQLNSTTKNRRITNAITIQRVGQILRANNFEKVGEVNRRSLWRIKND